MDLLGERRRLVPLLDPVLLSDLQARVRAHSLPPRNVSASGQRASSLSLKAQLAAFHATGMNSGADTDGGAEVGASGNGTTATAPPTRANVNPEKNRLECIFHFIRIFKHIDRSLTSNNSSSSRITLFHVANMRVFVHLYERNESKFNKQIEENLELRLSLIIMSITIKLYSGLKHAVYSTVFLL